jgi:hypothetical protein
MSDLTQAVAEAVLDVKAAIDSLASVSPISAAVVAQLLNDAGGFDAITAGDRIDLNGAIFEEYRSFDQNYSNIRITPQDSNILSRIVLFYEALTTNAVRVELHAGVGDKISRITLTPDTTASQIELNGSPVLAERDLPLPGMWERLVDNSFLHANETDDIVVNDTPGLIAVREMGANVRVDVYTYGGNTPGDLIRRLSEPGYLEITSISTGIRIRNTFTSGLVYSFHKLSLA